MKAFFTNPWTTLVLGALIMYSIVAVSKKKWNIFSAV